MDRSSIKRVFGCLLAAAVAISAVGCTNVKRTDYDILLEENNELRSQLAAIEGERAMWLDTKGKLEQENAELASALEALKAQGAIDADGGLNSAGGFNMPGTKMSMRASDLVVEVAGDVLFDSGQAKIKPSARATLNRVADMLKNEFAGYTVRIEGYTDTDPIRKSKWGTNERLSFERAFAVEKYLISRGINTKRMYTAAFGPDKPRNTKKESRRVEIVILGNE